MEESRIMVVDSSTVSRKIVARILRNAMEGAIVTTCASGAEAQEALSQNQYNLITTSLLLSDMDGLDFCRRIRASKAHSSTPLIVISGDADDRLLKEGFSAGVTDYFDKSHGYPEFGNYIKRFCQRNHGMVGRILYIEDSLTAATMTMRILEKHGLEVKHVLTAEEGMELVHKMRQRDGEIYDLVITDLYLKDEMSGGDLLCAMRNRFNYTQQELPVLMITGNDDSRTQIEAFHAGANDFVAKPLIEEVLMARVRSLLTIKHQSDALEKQAQTMKRVADSDSLTGVRNRRYMLENGQKLLQQANGQAFWAMILDIDHLRMINTEKGHISGDHILAAMGDLLNELFPDAMRVRFGGEEFALLLSDSSRSEALRRGEILRSATEVLQPEGIHVTISLGIAGIEDHPYADLNGLLGHADKALYYAKNKGRNQVCLAHSAGNIQVDPEYLATA